MNRFAPTIAFAAAIFGYAISGASAQQVGIAVCDDFLAKYEACVSGKVPAAQQSTFKASIDQTRKAWIEVSKSPAAKAQLELACKQAADQVKATLTPYGCSF